MINNSYIPYIILFVLSSFNSFSQSKKEQIEILTNRVDSLNLVLGSERSLNNNKINELNSTVKTLERQIADLTSNVTKLNTGLQEIKTDNLKRQIELETKQLEISKLQSALKIKSDSLEIIRKDLKNANNKNSLFHNIRTYYNYTEDQWILTDYMILDIYGDSVKGIWHTAAQGEWFRYFTGIKSNNKFVCRTDTRGKVEVFNFELIDKTLSLSKNIDSYHYSLLQCIKNPIISNQVYTSPNIKSQVVKILEDTEVEIIELGPFESNPNSSDIWYEIETSSGLKGWILGGINATSIENGY